MKQWTRVARGEQAAYQAPSGKPTASGYDAAAHEAQIERRWGDSSGAQVTLMGTTSREAYHAAHFEYTKAAAFNPVRHLMMVMGRPWVVRLDASNHLLLDISASFVDPMSSGTQ